jgi:4-hydroxybenzoyl-CoA thioesterase
MSQSQELPGPPANALLFSREIRIEWGDCDPAAIVFYPRYLAFFDANTAYLFEAAGMPKSDLVQSYDIVGVPLVDVGAKFFMPSRFGDRVIVESYVSEWRRSSFTVTHRLLRDGKLAIQAHETRVWAGKDPENPGGIKTRPIPAEVVARFTKS